MPPQNKVNDENITPQYPLVNNQITFHIPGGVPPLEVLACYIQVRRIIEGLYKALLITGKDMLITEFKYASCYRISIAVVPVFTNQHIFSELEIDFSKNIQKQFNNFVKDIKYLFAIARQLDDSPFADIWFR